MTDRHLPEQHDFAKHGTLEHQSGVVVYASAAICAHCGDRLQILGVLTEDGRIVLVLSDDIERDTTSLKPC